MAIAVTRTRLAKLVIYFKLFNNHRRLCLNLEYDQFICLNFGHDDGPNNLKGEDKIK